MTQRQWHEKRKQRKLKKLKRERQRQESRRGYSIHGRLDREMDARIKREP